jgi:hypothetical protein
MKNVSVVVDGRQFVVSEALARGLAQFLIAHELDSAAVLGTSYGGQVRFAEADEGEAYSLVGAALEAIDKAKQMVPPPLRRTDPSLVRLAGRYLDDMTDDIPF